MSKRMSDRPATEIGVDAAQVDASLAEGEALNGVPDFLQLPDEYRETIEQATLTAERMFWLRATHLIKDVATTTLLRRAIYAEQRCYESEFRLAEVSLIASGMKEKIEQLEDEIKIIAGHTG